MKPEDLVNEYIQDGIFDSKVPIVIEDRSFVNELFADAKPKDDGDDKNTKLKWWPIWEFNINDRFPIIMAVARIFDRLYFAFVSLIYLIISVFISFFFGDGKDKKHTKFRIIDKKTSARVNFVLLFSAVVFFVAAVAAIVAFFLNDVLLFKSKNFITENGSIKMEQPCGREHYMFLYNSAVCWENTGIQISAGDNVEISASGAFYGKISDLSESAKSNCELEYPWYNAALNRSELITDSILEPCMYKGEGAHFGSMLIQIHPENIGHHYHYTGNDSDFIKGEVLQLLPQKTEFEANVSGILYVAVNDIYLDKKSVDQILQLKEDGHDAVYERLIGRYKDNTIISKIFGDDYLRELSNIASKIVEIRNWVQTIVDNKCVNKDIELIDCINFFKECHNSRVVFASQLKHCEDLLISSDIVNLADEFKLKVTQLETLNQLSEVLNRIIEKYGLDDINSSKYKDYQAQQVLIRISEYPQYWFHDNIGEVLLNITITRNAIPQASPSTSIMVKLFRSFEDFVDFNKDNWWKKILVILFIFSAFVADYFVFDVIRNGKMKIKAKG